MVYLGNILVPHRTIYHILDYVDEVCGVLLVRPRLLLHLILLLDVQVVHLLRGRLVLEVLGVDKVLHKGVVDILVLVFL